MKFNINNEMVKKVGVVAGKLGKAIVIEGIKGVLLKSVTNTITTSFESGLSGVKKMTIDDYVGRKKKKLIDIPKIEKRTVLVVDEDVEVVTKQDTH
jgi:hypothetical protein